MSHIFISYSRKDLDFAQKIVDALAANDLDTWIDWKSIPKGEDWEQEIYRGIEEADAFLFLVSPNSVVSEMCNKEIEHAVENGKRILPIVIRDADVEKFLFEISGEEISKRNWIFCREGQDDFDKAIEETRETIHTDYEWLKYHPRLQVQALEWEKSQDVSRLLRGKGLREEEEKLAESHKDPQPTKLHRAYILASRKNEELQQRRITLSLGVGLIVVAALAVYAWVQRNTAINEANLRATAQANAEAETDAKATALFNEENARATAQTEKERAEKQTKIVLARQLASQAQALSTTGISKQIPAILLAIQSMRMFPQGEAAQVLQNNMLAHPISRMVIYKHAIATLALSPDGKYVVSGSTDDTARVWKTTTGQEIAYMRHGSDVNCVAFSPDGKFVVSGSYDGTIHVWEADTGNGIANMQHDLYVSSVAFSPDGKYVVSGSNDDTARVWEADTGLEVARMTHDSYVNSAVFSPDGQYVVSGGGFEDNTARVWSATTGQEISRMTHDDRVVSVAFSPDGKYSVSGSWDGTARVWEVDTGKEISRMTHEVGKVVSVGFSPDGRYVISSSYFFEGDARVWEVDTGKEVARMIHNDDHSVGGSVAFSSDGKYSVSISGNTSRVWEADTGQEIARIAHDSLVYTAAFSPDGKYVISGGCDEFDGNCVKGTARVWETTTGIEIARMTHDREVESVAFSPDGKFVISGSYDNTARVWIWHPDDLIANACSRITRNLTHTEWNQYIGDAMPYQAICPNLSIPEE